MSRVYAPIWQALKATGFVKLKLLDPLAKSRIIRGISKEKNADPSKPQMAKIFPTLEATNGETYLVLRLRDVIKTRYTVEL